MGALQSVQHAVGSSIATHKGHKSSVGQTVIQFFVKQPCIEIAAHVAVHPGTDHRSQSMVHRVDEEAFAGTASTSAQKEVHGQSSDNRYGTDNARKSQQGLAAPVMDSTTSLGTPDFHAADDPVAALSPLQPGSSSISKDDWRYSTWNGLQTVISNFHSLIAAVDQLAAAPNVSVTSLQDARVQCQALLEIATARLEELLNSNVISSSEKAIVEMERGHIDMLRLVEKSDAIRSMLIDFASGTDDQGMSHSASSGAVDSDPGQPSAAQIPARQRLMAPKAGKTTHKIKKSGKRSGPAPLDKNNEGKHVRR